MKTRYLVPTPSNWPGLAECACYRSDPTPSPYSSAGQDEHEVFAAQLTGMESPKSREAFERMTPAQRESVQWAVDYVKLNSHGAIHVEERLELINPDFDVITAGKIDAWSYQPISDRSAVDLFDYKSGNPHNYRAQMIPYSLALMQRAAAKECRIHLLYGRSKYADNKTVITAAEATDYVTKFVERYQSPEKKPTPCDHCSFCANRLTCPPLVAMAKEIAEGYSDGVLKFPEWHPSKIEDPAAMSAALKAANIIEAWIKSVKNHAWGMAVKQGRTIPDFKIQIRAGKREVSDLAAAFSKAGLPQETFLACCDIRFGELEEAFQKVHGTPSLAAAKRELANRLGELITRRADSKSLVQINKEEEPSS
jgi:hypothetical protein